MFTAFYVRSLVSINKVLALVKVRLKMEVYWVSELLKNYRAKVRVRLKIEISCHF